MGIRGIVGSENIFKVRNFCPYPKCQSTSDSASPSHMALWLSPHPQNLNRKSKKRIGVIFKKITSRAIHTSEIMRMGGPFPTLSLGKADFTGFSWRRNNPFFVQQDDVTSSSAGLGWTWASERAI